MQELRKLVRSTHHLLVFEAAARHRSFTRAAEELGVSQPAVSQAIRDLEASLGVGLFMRGHRSITLTEAGGILFRDVSLGFGRIAETAKFLQRRRQQLPVTLSASTAFANYWMVPRLADLHARHPGIDLRLQTTDKDLDLTEEGVSLGVRRGDGNWSGYESRLIAEEVIVPVARPEIARSLAGIDPADLARQRLIHLEEPHRPRPSWGEWFAAMGVSYRDDGKGLRLNDYALVLQAAMAGEGIAIGWNHVIDRLIEQDLLHIVGTEAWRSGIGFHLIWSRRTPLSDQASAVRDWILATAADQADLAASSGISTKGSTTIR